MSNIGLNQILIITEDNDIQPIGAVLELEDLSINIPKAYTFWLSNYNDEFKSLITNNKIEIKSSKNNIITDIDSESNIILNNSITYTDSGIHLFFESDTQIIEDIQIDIIDINSNSILFSFYVNQKYIDLQDRLYVAANNYGIQINEDWNKAFYESDIHENNADYVLHNRKLSEFLLHSFELIGLRGSYKTFLTAINYFGYKDILWFEETWINKENKRRLTEINNSLIDKHFVKDGYTKIGELIMFYSLDKLEDEEPFDEGGLPQYEYRNISYKDLYTKLVILRKILEKWFLPFDVYITDIIGEFHGVAGLKKKIWTAEDIFINQDEHKRFDFIDIEWDGTHEQDGKKYAFISEHKFIADVDLFSVINDKLVLNQTDTAHLKTPIIKLDKIDDEIVDLEDYDILTKFFVQDVGILNQKITLHSEIPDYIFGFKLRLTRITNKGNDVLYLSKMLPKEQLFNITRLGIRLLGDFEISITAFDKYGYTKTWAEKFSIVKETLAFNFLCLRPEYINKDSDNWKRFLHFTTVQETNSKLGVPIVDAAYQSGWNINNPDFIPPGVKIARRYYHAGSNIESPTIKKKRNIIINQLNEIPISENWNPFNLCFVDFNHNTSFKISLKTFPHFEWDTIEYENESQFLNELSIKSKNPNTPYNFFDFDIQYLNTFYKERLNIDERDKSFKVLVIFDKLKSFSLDSIIFKFEIDDMIITNDNGEENNPKITLRNITSDKIWYNSIFPSFGFDPMIKFNDIFNTDNITPTETLDYRLRLKIGTTDIISIKEYGSSNVNSEPQFNFGNLKNILKDLLSEDMFDKLEIYFAFDTFTIRHKYGEYIEVSHISLGHKIATKRDGAIKKLFHTVSGSVYQVGSMVILMPDEEIKINNLDVNWKIYDSFTGLKYLESKNYVCKWIPYRTGVYDVECITTDKLTGSELVCKKRACILIE